MASVGVLIGLEPTMCIFQASLIQYFTLSSFFWYFPFDMCLSRMCLSFSTRDYEPFRSAGLHVSHSTFMSYWSNKRSLTTLRYGRTRCLGVRWSPIHPSRYWFVLSNTSVRVFSLLFSGACGIFSSRPDDRCIRFAEYALVWNHAIPDLGSVLRILAPLIAICSLTEFNRESSLFLLMFIYLVCIRLLTYFTPLLLSLVFNFIIYVLVIRSLSNDAKQVIIVFLSASAFDIFFFWHMAIRILFLILLDVKHDAFLFALCGPVIFSKKKTRGRFNLVCTNTWRCFCSVGCGRACIPLTKTIFRWRSFRLCFHHCRCTICFCVSVCGYAHACENVFDDLLFFCWICVRVSWMPLCMD